jgi:hypothetical protein
MAALHELIIGFALSNEILLHHGPALPAPSISPWYPSSYITPFNSPNQRKSNAQGLVVARQPVSLKQNFTFVVGIELTSEHKWHMVLMLDYERCLV